MLGRSLGVPLASVVLTHLSTERQDIVTNVHSPSCEASSYFYFILAELEFGRQILSQKPVHIKLIGPVRERGCFIRTERQTYRQTDL